METLEILTYFNVETLWLTFNSLALLMRHPATQTMFYIAFMFSIVVFVLTTYYNKDLTFFKWFAQTFLIVAILIGPSVRTVITDRGGVEPPRTVDNVPWFPAYMAYIFSNTMSRMTELTEEFFNIPDDINSTANGISFGQRIIRRATEMPFVTKFLQIDIDQYMKECALYDIRDGIIDLDAIEKSTDAWSDIFANPHPSRFVAFGIGTNNPQTYTCTQAATNLIPRINNEATLALTKLGKEIYPGAASDTAARTSLSNALGAGSNFLYRSGQSAADLMKQNLFNQVWREVGSNVASLTGAAPETISANLAAAEAAYKQNTIGNVLRILGEEAIPMLRNWIEALMYIFFPLMIFALIFMSPDAQRKAITNYIKTILWLNTWPIAFAAINFMALVYLRQKLRSYGLDAGVTPGTVGIVNATMLEHQSMLGFFIMMVPAMTWKLIYNEGINSIADQALSGLKSLGSSSGGQWAGGNVQLGRQHIDDASLNTTRGNQHDFQESYLAHRSHLAMASGQHIIAGARGNEVIQDMRSSYEGISVNSGAAQHARAVNSESQSVDASRSTGKDFSSSIRSDSTESFLAQTSSGQYLARTGQVSEGAQGSQSTNSGTQWSYGEQGGISSRFGQFANADSTNSGGVGANLGLSGGGGGGGGGKGGGLGGIGANMGKNLSNAIGENTGKESSYSNTGSVNENVGGSTQYQKTGGASDTYSDTKNFNQNQIGSSGQSNTLSREGKQNESAALRQSSSASQSRDVSSDQYINQIRDYATGSASDIAKHHGLNTVAFASLPIEERQRLIGDYVAHRESQKTAAFTAGNVRDAAAIARENEQNRSEIRGVATQKISGVSNNVQSKDAPAIIGNSEEKNRQAQKNAGTSARAKINEGKAQSGHEVEVSDRNVSALKAEASRYDDISNRMGNPFNSLKN
jgi:conjugal transfer mating pair stabilization protein TraG